MSIFNIIFLISSIALAEVNLDGVRFKIAAASKLMATNESQLNAVSSSLKALKTQILKECGVDFDSTRPSENKCSPEKYSALTRSFSQVFNTERELEQKLADAKAEYKKILVDAKSDLSSKDFVALMSTSQDLNDAELKKLALSSKAESIRNDIERAKLELMNTDGYKMMTKGLTNLLNSKLFCQARDRCDGNAGNIYEGEVSSKILSNAAKSLAKDKINAASGGSSTK